MPVPHVVIIGGGFAGLSAARELRKAPVRITLVDRTNHHTFQPLLYQVATAALAPSDITVPIRWRLRKQRNVTVLLAEVLGIDADARRVTLDDGTGLDYDFLVVATGARHAYFGNDEWEQFAPGLKTLDDARDMRQRFLLAFEHAERTSDPVERAAHLTIVVVGAGPTGTELAGSIPDIARKALRSDFRNFDTRDTRVLLVEAGKRILPTFPEDLGQAAHHDLESLGVEVRLGTPVTRIESDAVWIGTERVPCRTVFWAAGNVASPLGRATGGEVDRAGRVLVNDDCSVPGHPELFVVGDLSVVKRQDGSPAPAVAPTANQTGAHAARTIRRTLAGEPREPFKYFHKGDLAVIGRHRAVAALGKLKFTGNIAWLLWLFVHLMYLVGFRNRASVLLQWAYAYFTYQRGVRLIVGGSRPATARLRAPHPAVVVAANDGVPVGDAPPAAVPSAR